MELSTYKIVLTIAAFCCLEKNSVIGLQSSVMADLKEAEQLMSSSHKVKRAQEVVMFGNQQNKYSDPNYVRADKRDLSSLPVPTEDEVSKDELEEPIAMSSVDQETGPVYTQFYPMRDNYYFQPAPEEYDNVPYEGNQERNIMKRSPNKRSGRYRTKRDNQLSHIDPEDLVSLLEMLEEEQASQIGHKSRGLGQLGEVPSLSSNWRGSQRRAKTEYDSYPYEIMNHEGRSPNEELVDIPVSAYHYNHKVKYHPSYKNFIGMRQRRSFNYLPYHVEAVSDHKPGATSPKTLL